MPKRRRRHTGPTPPRRLVGGRLYFDGGAAGPSLVVDDVGELPGLPDEMPANVRAFLDQLEAGQRAGDLPDGQRWHLDVGWQVGAAQVELLIPRLCEAPEHVPCTGECR